MGSMDVTALAEEELVTDELDISDETALEDELDSCEDALELLNDDCDEGLDEDEPPQATSAASDAVRTRVFIQMEKLKW